MIFERALRRAIYRRVKRAEAFKIIGAVERQSMEGLPPGQIRPEWPRIVVRRAERRERG